MCLLALAVLFLGSAAGKFQNPKAFLRAVTAYQLLPAGLNAAVAATFPGIELVVGALMLAGLLWVWRTSAARAAFDSYVEAAGGVIAGMLGLFIVVMSVDILRGVKLDCGCFDMLGQALPFLKAHKVTWGTVLRDVVMLALAVPVVVRDPRPAPARG